MIAGSNRARTFGTLSIEWQLPLAIHALPCRDLVAEASEVSQKMANGEAFRFSRNRRTAPHYRMRTVCRCFQNSSERVFESGKTAALVSPSAQIISISLKYLKVIAARSHSSLRSPLSA